MERTGMNLICLISVVLLTFRYGNGERVGTIFPSEMIERNARQTENYGCTRNLRVGSGRGFLTSPGYPNNYPSSSDCRWLLTSSKRNGNITLKINSLVMEEDTDCRLDYLQVYLGPNGLAPSLGPFCGQISNRVLKTNSSQVLVVFHSDPVNEYKGFSLEYYAQAGGGCDKQFTGDSGELYSPSYPNNYPDNADCWMTITVTPGKQVSLMFDVIDLEFDEKCNLDYVNVFDGSTENSTLLARVCNGIHNFESTGNYLLVHFHSDETYNKKGFHAKYEAIDRRLQPMGDCLWQRGTFNGSVASPNYPNKYPESSYCVIWLIAPLGHWISIAFDTFRLEPEDNCDADYLQIREGPIADSRILGTFCDSENEPKNLTSARNEVQIIFHSDDAFQFSGFKFRYWFKSNQTDSKNNQPIKTEQDEAITFDVVPQNATLEVGSSHILNCRTNKPDVKIGWLKGDQLLSVPTPLSGLKQLSNNSLWIQSMDHHLSGVYTCVAVSRRETSKARAFVVIENDLNSMNSACGIVFRKIPRHVTYVEGEFAQLECLASGEYVRTSWEKDGQPLRSKPNVLLLRNGVLYVDRITMEDAGVYTCRAYDQVTQCQKRVSALLQVTKRTNIDEICGKPRVGQPSADVPQINHGKIIGGSNAKKGAYPWQVMLWEPNLKSFCGGTLLNERWIITAAHCFVNYSNLRWDRIVIKLGKHDRELKEEEELVTGIADPSSIVVHPNYKKRTFDNDLALIRLRDYVTFSNYILPICLGDQNTVESLMRIGNVAMGTVTGWGKLKESGPSPRYLQEIRLPVVDRSVCVASTNYTVSRNMFCAGYSQEIIGDACHGDSGGPFLMSQQDRWYLAGIVSWGEGCGQIGKYGFYTKIAEYLPWIKGIIKS